jgi:hypothetical protein
MTPQTGTALLLLAAFVLPGFVTLLMRERTYTVPGEQTPFERLLRALYYAAVVYAVTLTAGLLAGLEKAQLVDLYRGRAPLWQMVGAGVLVVLLAPLAIAEASRRWRYSPWRAQLVARLGIRRTHDVDSGWNHAFATTGRAFVRVTTTDGRIVAGVYGRESVAGYSEHDRDLYLAQRWTLDDEQWFNAPAAGTLGIWLPRESIAAVEFYRVEDHTDPGGPPPVRG